MSKFLSFLILTNQNRFQWSLMFNKFHVNQSELSSTSPGFFNVFDIKQSSIPSQVIFVVITNQNEVFTDFKILCRSEPNSVWLMLFFRYSIQILKIRSKFFSICSVSNQCNYQNMNFLSLSLWYIVI